MKSRVARFFRTRKGPLSEQARAANFPCMNVALFVTCLVDHYFADAAADTVRLLRHLGCEVSFPPGQTCCGQPAYNAGRTGEARRMAEHTLNVFAGVDAVVLPSGSCAAMVKKFYPRMMGEAVPVDEAVPADGAVTAGAAAPETRATGPRSTTARASALADRSWDLAEFIVRRLGVTELGDGLAGRRVAVHQGCHALRELRLETEPAVLLEGAGAEVVPWEAQEECCGFGGLFSVKMTAVSTAMADRKLETLPDVDWVVSGDGGCMLHLDGRSRARGHGVEFLHLATALWRGVRGDGQARLRDGGAGRAALGDARRAAGATLTGAH